MTRQSANGQAPPPAPAGGVPLLRCHCGAAWLDDDGGRHAHQAVFGHQPRTREPETMPPEGDHQP